LAFLPVSRKKHTVSATSKEKEPACLAVPKSINFTARPSQPEALPTKSSFGILVESGGLQTLHRAQQEIVGLHIAMHDLHHVVEISDRRAMVMLAGDEPI
jgi:hypothetical protein